MYNESKDLYTGTSSSWSRNSEGERTGSPEDQMTEVAREPSVDKYVEGAAELTRSGVVVEKEGPRLLEGA